jgi:hypothetical protein
MLNILNIAYIDGMQQKINLITISHLLPQMSVSVAGSEGDQYAATISDLMFVPIFFIPPVVPYV